MLLEGVAKYAPDLKTPAWYRNAFSMASQSNKLTRDHFFDPSDILADLKRMQGIVAAHPESFPVMNWLRVGNQAGIKSLGPVSSSLDVYHEGEPSYIFGGWDRVELRPGYPADPGRPRIDLTSTSNFKCRLRSVNPIELDGVEVLVAIEREPFGSVIAPDLESARSRCRWANRNASLIVPFWS